MDTTMRNRIAALLLCLVVVGSLATAQTMTGLTYNVGFPSGNTKNFSGDVSWRGFGIDIRYFSDENLSLGGSFSWNIFDQLSRETIQLESGAVSGTNIRYINSFPFLLNAFYYFQDPRRELTPYVGINTGVYYIIQRFEIGVVAFENDNWHFALSPEAGIVWPVDRNTSILLGFRYNYPFDSGTSIGGRENNTWPYWGLNVGLGWTY